MNILTITNKCYYQGYLIIVKISDMLITCDFSWLIVSSNELKYFFNRIYGNCYTFNREKIGVRSVTKADIKIDIELFYLLIIIE
jgi:hypothetical protein